MGILTLFKNVDFSNEVMLVAALTSGQMFTLILPAYFTRLCQIKNIYKGKYYIVVLHCSPLTSMPVVQLRYILKKRNK